MMLTMMRGRSIESCGSYCSGSSKDKDKMSEVDASESQGKLIYEQQQLQSDREMFLNAFEKPTQIYRFMRERQFANPLFLQRTLTYMRHRLSKSRRYSNKKRSEYKVDDIMPKIEEQKRKDAHAQEIAGNLTINFSGIFDDTLKEDKESMYLTIELHQIGHKKRKDASTPSVITKVEKLVLKMNPPEGVVDHANSITIPKQDFTPQSGHLVKSYSLIFLATHSRANAINGSNALQETVPNEDNSLEKPVPKKRKLNESSTHYKAELLVFDKNERCQLTDADYQVVLQEFKPSINGPMSMQKRSKNTSWESISSEENDHFTDQNIHQHSPMDLITKGPILSFQVTWNRNNTANGHANPNTSLASAKKSEKKLSIFNNWFNSLCGNKAVKNGSYSETNSSQLNGSPNDSMVEKNSTRIVYQFLFNNNTRQQTKPKHDLQCPWCLLNCIQLYPLLKHLKLCHNRFTFTYNATNNGTRIDVAINECFDGSYTGNPNDLSCPQPGSFFSTAGPTRRTPMSQMLVCHPKRPPPSLSEFLEPDDDDEAMGRPVISGHNRLYYHSISCLPIKPQEMEYDSEGENDPEWMRAKSQSMIDEFTDVNEGEKSVMKLWNSHIMKEGFVGDCQVPLACTTFVEKKGQEIIANNLQKNFVLHLCNLSDFGLLNGSAMNEVLKKFNKLLDDYETNTAIDDKNTKVSNHHS